jgi:coenzyme F420-reducing hydrogenase beta subunit
MKSVYEAKENCCGCSACFNVCPVGAITMQPDEEGFLYPVINQSECTDCNKCAEVCPIRSGKNIKAVHIPKFYAAKHKSEDVLMESTSGGAFTAISDVFLKIGGVVYGADFDAGFKIVHRRAENEKQRNRMRVSKYAQSDLGNVFLQVRDDLANNKHVLFTGTPCQVAGLRGFIGDSPPVENLYLCDLICYGIPSPLVWKDYKDLLEKEYGGKLTEVQFRSKMVEWNRGNSNKSFMFKTSNSDEIHSDDRFYKLFFGAKTIMRPSCEVCSYTDIHRVSDITIADYWGIEKYAPEWMDARGVSLVMVNTAKGARIFKKCSHDLNTEERPAKEALAEQQRLSSPVKFPENRKEFWDKYRRLGLENYFKLNE